jgi:VWFA-related protein
MRSGSTCRRRRPRIAAACLTALAAVLVPILTGTGMRAQSPAAPPDAVFRSATDLVVLQVAVFDPQQRFVSDLRQDDFAVFDDGRRQPIVLFAATAAPLDLMVLLDTSGSMMGRLALARSAATKLISTLNEDDRGAVVLFSDRVQLAAPLTTDHKRLGAAIRYAEPGGRTALYESVYVALRELARTRAADGGLRRQAIVVLSDGDDNASRVTFDDLLEEARRGAGTVFTILPADDSSGARAAALLVSPSTAFEMRMLAEESGGRAFAPASFGDLNGTYEQNAAELGQQYWLAFAPEPGRGDAYRRVSVRVETRPGLRARTRSGYYPARVPASRSAAP